MSNLTPEVHINKNGVPVTKHVRLDPRAKASTVLPVPSVGGAAQRPVTPLLNDAVTEFIKPHLSGGAKDSSNSESSEVGFSVDDLDPEAAIEIERLLQADRAMHPKSYCVQSGLVTAMSKDTVEECVAFIHNIAAFGALIAVTRNASMTTYITGLSQYPDDVLEPDQDYILYAFESDRERAKNLLKFTIDAQRDSDALLVYDSFIETWDSEDGVSEVYTKLHDPELATYIMDHPEHGDDIISMVKEAGQALPVQLMADRMNHEVQSLRDGVL